MRPHAAALAALLFALAPRPAIAQGTPAAAPLEGLSFLTGCWRGDSGGGMTMEECWTAADADVMLATTRYVRGGTTTGWEFSRIHADSAGIVLTPYPDGRSSVSFRLVGSAPGEARFENPAHDFPKRILYRRTADGRLAVRVEDDTRGMAWELAPVPRP